jgi:hypothetical protein
MIAEPVLATSSLILADLIEPLPRQEDGQTGKPSATVRYQIVDTESGQSVVDFTQSTQELGSLGGEVTLEKSLPLSKLAPGSYLITVRVDDLVSRQTISPTAKFPVQ